MAETILTEKVRHPSDNNSWLITKDIQTYEDTSASPSVTKTQIRQYDGTNLLNVGSNYIVPTESSNYRYIPVTVTNGDNPSELELYAWDSNTQTYILTDDTEPQENEIYYKQDIDQYPRPVYIENGIFKPATSFNAASTLSLPINIEYGGTGATSAAEARANIEAVAESDFENLSNRVTSIENGSGITGVLSIEHGGTSASSAADARTALGLGALSTMSAIPAKTWLYDREKTGSARWSLSEYTGCYIYVGTIVKNWEGTAASTEQTIWFDDEFKQKFQTTQPNCCFVEFTDASSNASGGGPGYTWASHWGSGTYQGWHLRVQNSQSIGSTRRWNYVVIVPQQWHDTSYD